MRHGISIEWPSASPLLHPFFVVWLTSFFTMAYFTRLFNTVSISPVFLLPRSLSHRTISITKLKGKNDHRIMSVKTVLGHRLLLILKGSIIELYSFPLLFFFLILTSLFFFFPFLFAFSSSTLSYFPSLFYASSVFFFYSQVFSSSFYSYCFLSFVSFSIISFGFSFSF